MEEKHWFDYEFKNYADIEVAAKKELKNFSQTHILRTFYNQDKYEYMKMVLDNYNEKPISEYAREIFIEYAIQIPEYKNRIFEILKTLDANEQIAKMSYHFPELKNSIYEYLKKKKAYSSIRIFNELNLTKDEYNKKSKYYNNLVSGSGIKVLKNTPPEEFIPYLYKENYQFIVTAENFIECVKTHGIDKAIQQYPLPDYTIVELLPEDKKQDFIANPWKYKPINLIIDGLIVNPENKLDILNYYFNNSRDKFDYIIKQADTSSRSSKYITKSDVINFLQNKQSDLNEEENKIYKSFVDEKENNEYQKKLKQEQKNKIADELKKDPFYKDVEKTELSSFFTVNNFKLSNKEEYLFIINKFINQDLSIEKFCKKYNISDVNGFKKLLNSYSNINPEFKNQLIIKNTRISQNRFFAMKNIIESIINDPSSVEKIVASKQVTIQNILNFMKSQDYKTINKVSLNIIKYYYERLNSYDNSSTENSILRGLKTYEIFFLVGADSYRQMKCGQSIDLSAKIRSTFAELWKSDSKLLKQYFFGEKDNGINKKIAKYNDIYKPNAFKDVAISYKNKENNTVNVSQQMIDDCYKYIKDNELFPCPYVMHKTLRTYLNNDISLESSKEDMVKTKKVLLEKIKEITSIEEFFNAIDEYYEK